LPSTNDADYRRGRLSPEGYIDDSFDYAALKPMVFGPLRPAGTMRWACLGAAWLSG
jgi:hypothetical protein